MKNKQKTFMFVLIWASILWDSYQLWILKDREWLPGEPSVIAICTEKWKLFSPLTLWVFMNNTVHGVLQARILEPVAVPSPSNLPNRGTGVSWIAGGFFTSWAAREALTCTEGLGNKPLPLRWWPPCSRVGGLRHHLVALGEKKRLEVMLDGTRILL